MTNLRKKQDGINIGKILEKVHMMDRIELNEVAAMKIENKTNDQKQKYDQVMVGNI